MRATTTAKRLFLPAAALAAAAGFAFTQPADSDASEIAGFTQPSEEVELSFDNLGKISSVEVKPGDRVSAGDVLAVQDDRAEQAQKAAAEAEADVAGRVEVAEKRFELAKVQFERAEAGFDLGSTNQSEFEERRLERDIAEVQIGEEQKQGTVAEARVRQIDVVIDQKTLASPIDGIVRAVEAQPGEIFGPQTPAVSVVKIDPLYVEFYAPADAAADMKQGDSVQVRYGDANQTQPATLVFLDPLVDEGTGTRRVRAEMPNPDGLPAGLGVRVRLN